MFIDKNGKLFGKINIIDFLVLVVVILAIGVVGVRTVLPGVGGGLSGKSDSDKDKEKDTQLLELEYYIEEVDEWVAEKVKPGVDLYDGTYDMPVGEVVRVETDAPRTWGLTVDGQYVYAPRDGYVSMTIAGEVVGTKMEYGATINGKRYGVGHTMVLHAGDAKMYLRLHDIRVVDDNINDDEGAFTGIKRSKYEAKERRRKEGN